VQLYSVGGESRSCRLGVYTVRSGQVVQMAAGEGFDFQSYLFPGVRSASFALRATSSLKPCLSISVSGVNKGVTTTTRLAFTQGDSPTKLDVALFATRSVKGRKSVCSVSGGAATSAQYSAAFQKFSAAYVRKGSGLPYLTFTSRYSRAQLASGVSRLAARYKAHSTAGRVSLSRGSLRISYGASYTLRASVSPASAIYETVSWSSSDSKVVKVANGVLTAADVGTATITATAKSGARRSCKVTVIPPPAASVKVTGEAHTVLLRGTLALNAAVLPEKASKAVKWTSANASVASVSNGVVTGRRMGTTTIRAATANGKTSTFTVTVLAEALNKNGAIIDISKYNNVSSWGNLRKSAAFVIIRCGVTYSASHEKAGQMDIDSKFALHASKCLENGIPFGVYYYGMASTPEKARQEAEKAYAIASKYHPLFYAYDAEEAVLTGDSIEAFADRLHELGANKVGCYIAHHRYKQYGVDTSKFDFIWIPHYGEENDGQVGSTPSYRCDLHQYSSRGSVPGVGGNVDVNRLMGTKPLSFFTS